MAMLVDVLSGLFIALGVIALLIGSLGLVRLPDLFSRTHAVGMMDTAGAGFIILGLIIHEGFTLVSVKLALVGIFLFFTSPIATHAVAQVAYRAGLKPVLEEDRTVGRAKATPSAPRTKAAKKAAKKTAKAASSKAAKTVGKKAPGKKAPGKKASGKKAGGKR